MFTLLVLFGFWLTITILVILPLIVIFALGSFFAEKLNLDGIEYYLFMIIFYVLILFILILI